jgi:hypothetical protein
MSSLVSRRAILQFFGATAACTLLEPLARDKLLGAAPEALADGGNLLSFTPVRLPHPLPIYQQHPSYLATGLSTGTVLPAASNTQLVAYTVIDDVIVPPEYERYVIVHWGDRVFPNPDDYVGYNADYTGFIPIGNHDEDGNEHSGEQGYLWVNHEYVSYPASTLAPGIVGGLQNSPTTDNVVLGFSLPKGSAPTAATLALRLAGLSDAERRQLYGEFYYNQGGAVLVIARHSRKDHWEVSPLHPQNRCLHGLSGLAINATRTDGFETVTAWGPSDHEQGDDNYLMGTGPAATDVFESVNSDGLGNKIIGTAFNCSGATTPWGTIMSAEENFQGGTTGDSPFFMGVQEEVQPNGSQLGYLPTTAGVVASGTEFGQVGEKYGWLVEIDPADPDFQPRKHTALGRFRHENITLHCEPGAPLVAYMGDDRRGGHTWKYVSSDIVQRRPSKHNSQLLEEGTLYVARYHPDGTGQWIPLTPATPTNPLRPSEIASVPFANGFTSGTLFRHGAKIISPFIRPCILVSVHKHFLVNLTHFLKHWAA